MKSYHQTLGKSKDGLHSKSVGTQTYHSLISTFLIPKLGENQGYSKGPSLWHLLQDPQETNAYSKELRYLLELRNIII